MKYMHSEWKSRLRHWANTLEQDIYRPLGNIQFEGHLTMDHLTLEEAKTKEYKPMPAGTRWGET